jgi:hypothetical protein
MRTLVVAAGIFVTALLFQLHARAQGEDLLFDALTHPAIGYRSQPLHDPVAQLIARMQSGEAHLTFDATGAGYLRSVLDALKIPVESQMAVFSKTSLQSPLITPTNPRTIYFTDDVAVAWPRGGFIELAAHDPEKGAQFYILDQHDSPTPQILRAETVRPGACLACHHAFATMEVPGFIVKSVAAEPDGRAAPQAANYITDDRSPLDERWAGWYVTGRTGSARHIGNPDALSVREGRPEVTPHATTLDSLTKVIDTNRYLAASSDVAALLVFDHQARLMNTLTRVGWEVRVAVAEGRNAQTLIERNARDLVDALLFVEEAALPDGIASASGFAHAFEARGPADSRGRSLRQLALKGRLMQYPCSYMIYSPAFDGLPASLKEAVYRRLWTVLSGGDTAPRYARLTSADRRSIVEILRDTKRDLPPYFR